MLNAFEIAAHISMTTNAADVFGVLARHFLGLHRDIDTTSAKMKALGQVMTGALMVNAGAGIFKAFDNLLDKAAKFQAIVSTLQPAGFDPNRIGETVRNAQSVALNTPGLRFGTSLEDVKSLKEIVGNEDDARRLQPEIERAAVGLHYAAGLDTNSSLKYLLKALELREDIFEHNGKLDPSKFSEELNGAFKFLLATNGFISPQQLYTMMQQLKVAGKVNPDHPEEFWASQMALALEQGGARAGTGQAAIFRALVSEILPKNRIPALEDLGIVTHYQKHGKNRPATFEVTGQSVLESQGEDAWVSKILLPLLEKHGYKTLQQQIDWAQKNLPTDTARNSVAIELNRAAVEKAKQNYKSALGIDPTYQQQLADNPELRMDAFRASWDNLLTALGGPLVDPAIGFLNKLTTAINYLDKEALDHPTAVATIETMLGLFGGILIVGGSLKIAIGALSGFSDALTLFGAGSKAQKALSILGAAAGVEGSLASVAAGLSALLAPAIALYGVYDLLHNKTRVDPNDGSYTDPSSGLLVVPPAVKKQSFHYAPTHDKPTVIQISSPIMLDGRKIGEHVAEYIARVVNRVPTGSTSFDPRMSPIPPGTVYSA